MSLTALIKDQVANAFVQLGDLKKSIVFNIASDRGYDFSTGEVSETASSITTEGVIEFVTVNEDNDVNSIFDSLRVKFIVNKADFSADLSQFDSFTTDGKVYRISNFEDNGFSVEGFGVGE